MHKRNGLIALWITSALNNVWTGKDEWNVAFLHVLLDAFQFQFERQWAPFSVTTLSPLGFMLVKSIRLLEWVLRIPCGAAPAICICHLLFSLTLFLLLCLLSPLDGTSYVCSPNSASLSPCPLYILFLCLLLPSTSPLSLPIKTFFYQAYCFLFAQVDILSWYDILLFVENIIMILLSLITEYNTKKTIYNACSMWVSKHGK